MEHIQQIFGEYERLRSRGMAMKAILNTLQHEIDRLTEQDKQELARRLRAAEASKKGPKPPPFSSDTGLITSRVPDIVWVSCPNCGKSNQKHELLCYSCGQLLDRTRSESETQALAETNDLTMSDDFYGQDTTLELKVRDTGAIFTIQPQNCEHEVIVGRSTPGSAMVPDVDLGDADGDHYGVSRLHLTVRYQARYNTLSVLDLGSANGTYVNGQRLHPHEVRVLRNGDELRLGRMILGVVFNHA